MEKKVYGLSEMDDMDLLDLAVESKDQKAWTELVKRYYSKVSATVYRIFGYNAEAEDIVQEVFMELAKSVKNFRRDSSFSTFLYRVSVNTAYRYIKRNTSKDVVSDSIEFLSNMLLSKKDEDFTYEKKEQSVIVNKALKTLSPEKRMALVLFEVEDLTLKEIAEVLKVPLQTVWSRVYNGRKELFTKLSESLNS
ncbi:MAG TPA: RNA polymerase sigma factor [bacterium]|nr:RNA polymerase sigma factor [bacterium]HPS29761.1 RNA polymerase sigma factor [bacterium]